MKRFLFSSTALTLSLFIILISHDALSKDDFSSVHPILSNANPHNHYLLGERQDAPLAIIHATIIDVVRSVSKPDMTVIIRGNRIASAGNTDRMPIPENAHIIDGTGKFLIPGLWDSHVHLSYAGESVLKHFISNGVTSVRDMGSSLAEINDWRSRIEDGSLTGPRILTSGPAIESAQFIEIIKRVDQIFGIALSDFLLPTRLGVGNATEAKEAVDALVSNGADFIKVRTIPSIQTYQAVLEEAAKTGKTVAGHEPMMIPLNQAVDMGLSCIEHIPFLSLTGLSDKERMTVFENMRSRRPWIVPTIIATEKYRLTPDSIVRKIILDTDNQIDARRKHISDNLLDFWDMQVRIKALEAPMNWEILLKKGIDDLRALHSMGFPVMAGTDFSIPLVYPGSSLHEELENLVDKGGLTPMEALQGATLYPAKFFTMEDSLGAIEEGKIADIIVLNKNPLENIAHTRTIGLVIQGGKIYQGDSGKATGNRRKPCLSGSKRCRWNAG